jgi:hypothetical protein
MDARIGVQQFIDRNPLLRIRTKNWLLYNPGKLQEFIDSDYTRNPNHYRKLSYYENEEIRKYWWTPEQHEAERVAYKAFGGLLADEMYTRANSEAFMRKYLRKITEHTVPEHAYLEVVKAKRIQRHMQVPRLQIREIVKLLRNL